MFRPHLSFLADFRQETSVLARNECILLLLPIFNNFTAKLSLGISGKAACPSYVSRLCASAHAALSRGSNGGADHSCYN